MSISSHISEATNIRAYLKNFTKNKVKFNALGMVLNSVVNHKLYIEDVDFFVDTLFQSVYCDRSELEFL